MSSVNLVELNTPKKLETMVEEFLLDFETSPEMTYCNENLDSFEPLLSCDGEIGEKAKHMFKLVDLIKAKVVVCEQLKANPMIIDKFKQSQLNKVIAEISIAFEALEKLAELKFFFVAFVILDDKAGYSYNKWFIHDGMLEVLKHGLEMDSIN